MDHCEKSTKIKSFKDLNMIDTTAAFLDDIGIKPAALVALLRYECIKISRQNIFYDKLGECENLSELHDAMIICHIAQAKFEKKCLKYFTTGPLARSAIRNAFWCAKDVLENKGMIKHNWDDKKESQVKHFLSFFSRELQDIILNPTYSNDPELYNKFYEAYYNSEKKLTKRFLILVRGVLSPDQYKIFIFDTMHLTNERRKVYFYEDSEKKLLNAARTNLNNKDVTNEMKRIIREF